MISSDPQASLGNDLFFSALVRGDVEDNPRFLRREWLAKELDRKLREAGCRFALLTAEPGAGKSVFMAQLAHDHPEWLRYFIRRDQRSVLADVLDKSLLLRIGYQLAALRPELFSQAQLRVSISQRIGQVAEQGEAVGAEVKRLTASPFYQKILQIEQDVQTNTGKVVGLRVEELVIETRLLPAEDLLHLGLIDPARALQRSDPNQQIVILIDALDEIRYHGTEENILAWLTNCPALPDNIRFVLTSRPPDEMLNLFRTKQANLLAELAIVEEDPRVKQDIEHFVTALVGEQQVAQALQAAKSDAKTFAKEATDKAYGNLGYLDALARGIDQATRSDNHAALQALLSLKELPGDLEELYAFFLHQIKAAVSRERVELKDPETGETYDKPIWPAVYDRILGVLVVAMEPLDLDLLARLGGSRVERSWVGNALDRLLQFLDVIDNCYRFYHATVAEFLTSEKTRSNPATTDLYQDGKQRHHQIADYYWQTYGSDQERWLDCEDEYAIRYTPLHMIEALQQMNKPDQEPARVSVLDQLTKLMNSKNFLVASYARVDGARTQHRPDVPGEHVQPAVAAAFPESESSRFYGREWLLGKLDDWLAHDKGRRYFVITGEPGSGKTALAAQLVRISNSDAPAAFHHLGPSWLTGAHFCQFMNPSTTDPCSFIDTASRALSGRYRTFAKTLANAIEISTQVGFVPTLDAVRQRVRRVVLDFLRYLPTEEGLHLVLLDPLARLCVERPTERIVILVDALDEALTWLGSQNIASVLSRFDMLPPHVRCVITTRLHPRVFHVFGDSACWLDLSVDRAANLADVRGYVQSRLGLLPNARRTEIAHRIVESSHGNMMYAQHLLEDLLRGKDMQTEAGVDQVLAELETLPSNLSELYRRAIRQIEDRRGYRWEGWLRPVLGALAVAQGEGLTAGQIAKVSGMKQDDVNDILAALSNLVWRQAPQGSYRLYHSSLRDLLFADPEFRVDAEEAHRALVEFCLARCGRNWSECQDIYAVKQTASHMTELAQIAARPEDRHAWLNALVDLVTNRDYEEMKIGRSQTGELLTELRTAVDMLPAEDERRPELVRVLKQIGARMTLAKS
jgi:archaellum biogenesis ATPase FlaH